MNTTLALASLLALVAISSPDRKHNENVQLDAPVAIACQSFGPGKLHVTWTGTAPSSAQFSMGGHTVEAPIKLVAAEHSNVAVLTDAQGDNTILSQLYLPHFTVELSAGAPCSRLASK